MSSTLTNGRQRKSLGEQLDRFDSLLDGLSEGLNEAVAGAVKEAVGLVLTEVLTNPELRAGLQTAPDAGPATAASPRGEWLARIGERVRDTCRLLGQRVASCWLPVAQACAVGWRWVKEAVRRAKVKVLRLLGWGGGWLLRVRRFAAAVLAAVALGTLTAIAGCLLGPWFGSAVAAAGGLGIALSPSTRPTWLPPTWLRPAQAE